MMGVLMASAIAGHQSKSAFYFSRFNFTRMRERGNTHYCFHCGGDHGFTPGPNGEATNCDRPSRIEPDGVYNPMKDHDPATHATGVVGGADQYATVWEWFEHMKLPARFPYVVHIPSID